MVPLYLNAVNQDLQQFVGQTAPLNSFELVHLLFIANTTWDIMTMGIYRDILGFSRSTDTVETACSAVQACVDMIYSYRR